MDVASKLETSVGGVWHGISFLDQAPPNGQSFHGSQNVRFCKAIRLARVEKIIMVPERLACPGARYAFGCGDDLKETLKKGLVKEGYSLQIAERMINETPRLEKRPAAIGLNIEEQPDVLLSMIQPEAMMHLLQLYYKRSSHSLQTDISCILSACSNVSVRAFLSKDAAISFGCLDSRKYSGISRDRLFVGLPYTLARDLFADQSGSIK